MSKTKSHLKNWREVKLGEVASINPDSVSKNFPFEQILYTDISSVGSGIAETPTETPFSEAPSRARRLVKNGDTILSTVRPNRRSFLYIKNPEENRVVSTGFAVLRAGTKIDPRFLYYLISNQSFTDYLTLHAKGAAYPAVDEEIIANARIILPEFDKQKDIGSILSTYDDLIENNTKRIEILEEIAQAIYREWFEKNAKFKNQNAKLSEIVKPQYGHTESASDEKIGPKYLRGTDINKNSYIDWSTVPYCKISDEDKKKYQLQKNDIVIIRMADPGKIGMVEQEVDAVFASYLIRFKIVDERISPYYLFYFLNSDQYQNYIQGASGGTTRKSASAGVVTGIDIAIPPKDLVDKFEAKISLLRSELNNLLVQNAKLRQVRDLLLPKLVTGEIEIKI